MIWIWIRGLIGSRQGRLFGAMLGVGITVGLIVAIGTFTANASRGMTARAIAGVPVDWQIEFFPGADRAAILADLNQAAHPTASAMVGYAAVAGFKATTGQTEQSTGTGKVLGLPPNYLQTFPNQIRLLVGTWNGALLAQQTAANLHVGVGDVVSIERSGLAPVKVEVVFLGCFLVGSSRVDLQACKLEYSIVSPK